MRPDKHKGMFGNFETNVSHAGAETINRLEDSKRSTGPSVRDIAAAARRLARRHGLKVRNCSACHLPMLVIEPGQVTHPCCEPRWER